MKSLPNSHDYTKAFLIKFKDDYSILAIYNNGKTMKEVGAEYPKALSIERMNVGIINIK